MNGINESGDAVQYVTQYSHKNKTVQASTASVIFFLASNSHVEQVLIIAIEHIHIDIVVNAINLAPVGMLPEMPLTSIFEFIHIVVSNPIRIAVKLRRVEITLLETV